MLNFLKNKVKLYSIKLFFFICMKVKINDRKTFFDNGYVKVFNIPVSNMSSYEDDHINANVVIGLGPSLLLKFIVSIFKLIIKFDDDFALDTYSLAILNYDRIKKNKIQLKYYVQCKIDDGDIILILNVLCKKEQSSKLKLLGGIVVK